MPKLFLLFSHSLTEAQRADAESSLNITEFIGLPDDLQTRWSNVPPELESLDEHLRPLLDWLSDTASPGDYLLAQGDFGAVYATVHFALEHDLIPIYATTRRQVYENALPDGKVQIERVFEHVRFRRYQ